MPTVFEQIVQRIVKEQELIIGPLAREEALRVQGITFAGADYQNVSSIVLSGDSRSLIDQLVARYERLFGRASVQVCRDAAAPLLPEINKKDIPSSLQ